MSKLADFLKKIFHSGIRGEPEKFLVAEVMAWQKHPNADRLRVVSLNIGDQTVDPVVCGASNFDVGDKVVLARPGAQFLRSHKSDQPFILAKATIRGVESQGMICSKYELGLEEEESEGILVLPKTARPGQAFSAKMVSPD